MPMTPVDAFLIPSQTSFSGGAGFILNFLGNFNFHLFAIIAQYNLYVKYLIYRSGDMRESRGVMDYGYYRHYITSLPVFSRLASPASNIV